MKGPGCGGGERKNIPDIRLDGPLERIEDIPNVVLRRDARAEHRVPVAEDVVHDGPAGDVDVLQGLEEAALVVVEELLRGGLAGRGAVEVGGRAQGDDPAEIDAAVQGAAQQGFHHRVVFLRRGAVPPRAVRQQRDVVAEGFAQELPVPEGVRGGHVAFDHGWGLVGGRVGVFLAVGFGHGAVV